MAARVIVAIENPQDIIVQSARPYGQRAVLKFAHYTGANAIAGRHTPGTFTNQLQTTFCEPRLLILTDPRTDHQVFVPCDALFCCYICLYIDDYFHFFFLSPPNVCVLHNMCTAHQRSSSWKHPHHCFL